MASYRKRGGRWQVQVRRQGRHASATFGTRAAARAWAERQERAIDDGRAGIAPAVTLGELLDRYELEMRRVKPLGRSKAAVLRALHRDLGHVRIRDLTTDRVLAWARQRTAGPVTVGVDLSYLGTVLRTARAVWRLPVSDEPVRDARAALAMVGMVGRSRSRDRRPTAEELQALRAWFVARPRSDVPMADLMDFAIASAMRMGEIVGLRWADLDAGRRVIVIRDRKHPRQQRGNDERVPLLALGGLDALELALRQPRRGERIWPYQSRTVSRAWARATAALGIAGLTFHDLRHEGASRMFEHGLPIEHVALVTGHRDWRTLRRYVQLRAEHVVARLTARQG